ncbi:hypothetical protein GVAV_000804 [Gurleya vavrai]
MIETCFKTHFLFVTLYIYIEGLAVFYYCKLLKISPGSLVDFNGLEVRGNCLKCNRLRSNRTFHCDNCNKCYYKRDHHCPWIGKCIAAGNYKEYYLFVGFMTLFLGFTFLRSDCFHEIAFFNNTVFCFFSLFFIWINFLLCIDRTSIEYQKKKENSFIKYNSLWYKLEKNNWKRKIESNVLDGNIKNIKYVFFPFLYLQARINEFD